MSLAELRARQQRQQRLAHLAVACAVVLAVVALAACGPGDTDIARSGVPVTEPRVVAMTAVPAEPLVTTSTSTAPPVVAQSTTSAVPLLEAAEPPVPQAVTPAGPVDHSDCAGWGDLVAAYFPGGQVAKACSVLACESNGNPSAASPTNDHGLFQLHAGSSGFPGGWQSTFLDVTGVAFFDGVYSPDLNVRFARWLWGQSGWSPWACA